MSKYRLELLEKKELLEGNYYVDCMYVSPDGETIMFPTRNPSKEPKDHVLVISHDGGKTVTRTNDDFYHFITLKDGSVFAAAGGNMVFDKFRRTQEKIPYIGKVIRAESVEAMLAGNYEETFAKVEIPDLAIGYGDGNNAHSGSFDHGMVELDNGDILCTMYGQFKQDKNRVDYIPGEYYQYRSWVVVTHDRGESFEYLSTLADANNAPLPAYAEGYCEPDMIKLRDGSLFAVMRSGGFYEGGADCYTPLYAVRSTDNGKTWSAPVAVNWHGVYPKAVQTENGAIVVTAGRDGQFVSVGDETGTQWSEAYYLTQSKGKWGQVPSGYASLHDCGNNEVMVVYDDGCEEWYAGDPDPEPKKGAHHKIFIARFKVVKE